EMSVHPLAQEGALLGRQLRAVLQVEDLDQAVAVGERVIVDKPVQEAQELRLAQGVRELADPVAEVEVERLFQLPVKPGTAGKPAQLVPELLGRLFQPPGPPSPIRPAQEPGTSTRPRARPCSCSCPFMRAAPPGYPSRPGAARRQTRPAAPEPGCSCPLRLWPGR